ncbi:MAG TPA: amidohydrolase family protein [Steroidobacteraceae bacterium]|jgi:imidazolonepropionase-like amidohydrolase|nr:amidohydrolase family protein [Steroidobacteraceae bacterium]
MNTPRSAILLWCAALGACAYTPPTLTSLLDIRHAPYTPDSGSIAIRCGTLIDGLADSAKKNTLVVIRDGRIKTVQPDASYADAVATHFPILDLTGSTCLPGLIDMHGHVTDRPEDTADLTVYFSRTAEETLRQGKENASATLLAGFTSVRNVGTYVLGADTELRDTINAGKSLGPRLQVSGPYLTIPHGGGDLYIPDFKEPADNARFHAGVARGPEQFRERAEFLLDNGSDLLKVIASGAVLAFGGVPGAPEMTQEEIAAVVEVAHAAGKKVAAHAHGAESILMAIAAGVDTVEHASYLDDAGIAAALKRGNVALAMDVYNGDYIDTEGRRQHWPEEFLRKNTETTEVQRQAFTKAVRAGVPIVFATDSGVFPHGLNARQFPIMVARGMTPMQAIKAATSVASHYMGWDDDVGAIAQGRFGDLIAVKGDPLKDIRLLENVQVVVKGGMLFKK